MAWTAEEARALADQILSASKADECEVNFEMSEPAHTRFAANEIEKVDLGTRVAVLQKERDWIKVKVKTSGKVGYMRKEYLAAAAVDTVN